MNRGNGDDDEMLNDDDDDSMNEEEEEEEEEEDPPLPFNHNAPLDDEVEDAVLIEQTSVLQVTQNIIQEFQREAVPLVNTWYRQARRSGRIPFRLFTDQGNNEEEEDVFVLESYTQIYKLLQVANHERQTLLYLFIMDMQFEILYYIFNLNHAILLLRQHNIIQSYRSPSQQPDIRNFVVVGDPFMITAAELTQVMYALFVEQAVSDKIKLSKFFVRWPALEEPERVFEFLIQTLAIAQWQPVNLMRVMSLTFHSLKYFRAQSGYVRGRYPAVNFDLSNDEKQNIRQRMMNRLQDTNATLMLLKPFRLRRQINTSHSYSARVTNMMIMDVMLFDNDVNINGGQQQRKHIPIVIALMLSYVTSCQKDVIKGFEEQLPTGTISVNIINRLLQRLDIETYIRTEGYAYLAEFLCAVDKVYGVYDMPVALPTIKIDILANILIHPIPRTRNTRLFVGKSYFIGRLYVLGVCHRKFIQGGFVFPNTIRYPNFALAWLKELEQLFITNDTTSVLTGNNNNNHNESSMAFPDNFLQLFSTLSASSIINGNEDEILVSNATMVFLCGGNYILSNHDLRMFYEFFLPYPALLILIRDDLRTLRVFFDSIHDDDDDDDDEDDDDDISNVNMNGWTNEQHTAYLREHTSKLYDDYETLPVREICLYFESDEIEQIISDYEKEQEIVKQFARNQEQRQRGTSSSSRSTEQISRQQLQQQERAHVDFQDDTWLDRHNDDRMEIDAPEPNEMAVFHPFLSQARTRGAQQLSLFPEL